MGEASAGVWAPLVIGKPVSKGLIGSLGHSQPQYHA